MLWPHIAPTSATAPNAQLLVQRAESRLEADGALGYEHIEQADTGRESERRERGEGTVAVCHGGPVDGEDDARGAAILIARNRRRNMLASTARTAIPVVYHYGTRCINAARPT